MSLNKRYGTCLFHIDHKAFYFKLYYFPDEKKIEKKLVRSLHGLGKVRCMVPVQIVRRDCFFIIFFILCSVFDLPSSCLYLSSIFALFAWCTGYHGCLASNQYYIFSSNIVFFVCVVFLIYWIHGIKAHALLHLEANLSFEILLKQIPSTCFRYTICCNSSTQLIHSHTHILVLIWWEQGRKQPSTFIPTHSIHIFQFYARSICYSNEKWNVWNWQMCLECLEYVGASEQKYYWW